MSEYLPDGEERRYKTCRIRLDMDKVQQYEELEAEKPSFSSLISQLLSDWLVSQQLKVEFKKINNVKT